MNTFDLKFRTINHKHYGFILPLFDAKDVDSSYEQFRDILKNILTDDQYTAKLNGICFSNMLYILKNKDPNRLCIDTQTVVGNYVNGFKEWFDVEKDNRTMSSQRFLDRYNSSYNKIAHLSELLQHIDNSLQTKKNSEQFLIMTWYCTFYKNIICKNYGAHDDIFNYLNSLEPFENNNFETLIPLFKLYLNYKHRFNGENMKSFLETFGDDNAFVNNMVTYINQCIKELNKEKNDDIKTNIFGLIDCATSFKQKDIFFAYYSEFLSNRLLYCRADLKTEMELLTLFNNNAMSLTEKRDLYTMACKIKDIELSDKLRKFYYEAVVSLQVNSEYSQSNIEQHSQIKKKIVPAVLRHGIWEGSKAPCLTEYVVPDELKCSLHIFKERVFKTRCRNKRLVWNFDIGNAVIKLNFPDRTYTVQLTNSQLFMLFQFKKKSQMTALELSNMMGISCHKMTPILLSLLTARILKRDMTKAPNDTGMTIWYNNEFTSNNEKISFAYLLNKPTKTNFNKHDAIQEIIMRKVSKCNISYDDLFEFLESVAPFAIQQDIFKNVVNDLVVCDKIKINDNEMISVGDNYKAQDCDLDVDDDSDDSD